MEIKLFDYFPKLYSGFFPEFFSSYISKEEIAVCADCIMLKPEKSLQQQVYYSEKSKCCTFFPYIPNYLAGLILSDTAKDFEQGREKLKEIIAKGQGISPKGISAGKKYSLLYKKSKKLAFGKNTSLICPFFVNRQNSCSIWNGRSAICSTFFCRYNAGVFGENFWRNIQFYLQETEKKLSKYAIMQLDALTDYFNHEPEESDFKPFEVDDAKHPDYEQIWGKWYGKEIEFYVRCYDVIASLTRTKFDEIMGISNRYYIQKISKAKDLMNNGNLPVRLKLNNKVNFFPVSGSKFLITSSFGSFEIDTELVDVLKLFDGNETVGSIINKLKNKNIILEKDLLLDFYYNRILIQA